MPSTPLRVTPWLLRLKTETETGTKKNTTPYAFDFAQGDTMAVETEN